MASVWGELKRRNVVRVAIAYIVVGWLLLQSADVLVPLLALPEWVGRLIFLLLLIGFPLALFFAWAYELTPAGLKKETDVDRSESITHITGRKLDFIIIGVLATALMIFALDKFFWTRSEAPTIANNSEPRTIAVLPFVNMSSDPEQEYFSDGLSEELLNLLARIPELRVTSRSSAFYYKDKEFKIADVGRELGVAHILEGSVRRSDDTIRITAQLIDVSTDTHLWVETWDRRFADVFVIQDEIAASVVKALKVSLLGDAPRVAETSPDAYSLFLESVYFYYKGESLRAEALIDRALEIDNQFAAGWAQLSWVRLVGTTNGLRPPIEGAALARAAAAEALRLDANNGTAHLTLSTIAGRYDYDMKTAKTELDLALQQIPGDSDALRIAAEWSIMAGDFEEAIRIAQEAELLDPRYVRNKVGIGMANFMARRFNDAKSAFGDAIALDSERLGVHYRMGAAMVVTGDYEGALEEFNRESRDGFVLTGRALAFHAMGDSARADEEFAKLIELGITWTYEIAKVHAYRGDLDDAFAWLDRAMDRRDQSLTYILGDPFMDNLRNDPRYDAVLERLGRKAP